MGRVIKNGIVYGGCTFGFQPIIYSTEEREVGVWLDGKPLYQKSLPVTNTTGSYSVNIASLSADAVIRIDIYLHNDTGGDYVCGTYYESNYDKLNYYFTSNKQYVVIRAGQTYSIGSGYITIYYTKTTDTAGSGTWTPQGIPAVHYVTGEHVIGTYTDGSTIYEQTYSISQSSFAVGWKWFAVNLTCSRIIDSEVNLKDTSSSYGYTGLPVAYQYSDGAIGVYNNMGGNMGDVTGYVTVRYIK